MALDSASEDPTLIEEGLNPCSNGKAGRTAVSFSSDFSTNLAKDPTSLIPNGKIFSWTILTKTAGNNSKSEANEIKIFLTNSLISNSG
ncbi:hypothetical protein WICPIJ_009805 [Wickerhamomyces pijperi]|uniref:Uncharacterized protein n=1 Tax=Wickerhamomyces pijperi TaxID=599730 RepID=A0A9P8PKC4_WICPI|nr:hypothetical protein WICPIJ_009805 [Wickerhamomyces pijperi]